jgi:hypothetical protein
MNNDALMMMARIVKSLVDKSGPYKLKPTQNDVPMTRIKPFIAC